VDHCLAFIARRFTTRVRRASGWRRPRGRA